MAIRQVHVSDMTQVEIPTAEQHIEAYIQHPGVEDRRAIDISTEELEALGKVAIEPVIVEARVPGEDEPQRFYLTAQAFGKLVVGRKATDMLEEARPVAPPQVRTIRPTRPQTDGADPSTAGDPRRGRCSPEEAAYVRDNLDAVNERLKAEGKRLIDPTNPQHAKRYGFADQPTLELVKQEGE